MLALALVLAAFQADPNDLSARVEIIRTAHGVPHIRAEDLKAFGYGLAWIQLEDYGPGVAHGILRTRGTLARVFGRDSIENDFFARPDRKSAELTYYKLDQAAPVAKIDDLANYDAIIVGTGTRFGRMASQMANFLDQAGGLWAKGALHGKVGGAFTSSATQHGGQETTLFSIITNLLHFGMTIVGLNYGFAGQMKLDEVTGGAPYGATTITGGDGSRQPSENELAGARYQGRVIAETANKLHG